MSRLSSTFFVGTLAAALVTNAVAVYLLYDVDEGLRGNWNAAYRDLSLEFLIFGFAVTLLFSLLTGFGRVIFKLRSVEVNLKLAFFLGIAVVVIQYPAEIAARILTRTPDADFFRSAYMLLSPLCSAAIVLIDSYRRRSAV